MGTSSQTSASDPRWVRRLARSSKKVVLRRKRDSLYICVPQVSGSKEYAWVNVFTTFCGKSEIMQVSSEGFSSHRYPREGWNKESWNCHEWRVLSSRAPTSARVILYVVQTVVRFVRAYSRVLLFLLNCSPHQRLFIGRRNRAKRACVDITSPPIQVPHRAFP